MRRLIPRPSHDGSHSHLFAGSRRFSAFRAALLVATSVAFTLAALRASFRNGRLSLPPVFDDIAYFLDAGRRVRDWQEHGAISVLRGLVTRPPHSPYSTLEAFFSFIFFGLHDWAPYAGNAVLVFGFLLLADRLTPGLRLWHKACLFLLVLCFPLMDRAATTCRPDFAAALLTTAGVFCIAGRAYGADCFVRSTAGRQARAGALFGLAVLAKPSVFPATAATLCACAAAAACAYVIMSRKRKVGSAGRPVPDAIRAFAVCAAAAVLVPAPYLFVHGRATLQYIYDNVIGPNADVWTVPGTLGQRLTYYVTGPGADGMLKGQRLALTLSIAAVVIFYARRRRLADWLASAPVAASLLVAYAICTWNGMKNDYLGLTFQVCLVFSIVAALRCLVVSQRLRRQPPWAESLLAMIALCGVAGFRWQDQFISPGNSAIRAQRAAIEQIYEAARSSARQTRPSSRPLRAFVAFSGRANATLFNYLALKEHEPIEFYDLSVVRDVSRYLAELDTADLVLLCDADMGEGLSRDEVGLAAGYVPNAALRAPLLAAVRSRTDFTLLARVLYRTSNRYFYVYGRVGRGSSGAN